MKHFVEINVMHKRKPTTLRFYGLGEWKVKDGKNWQPINAIYIPREALQIAASQCVPAPPVQPTGTFLTEIDIARLCGGSI